MEAYANMQSALAGNLVNPRASKRMS
jgi:hypothetical protein